MITPHLKEQIRRFIKAMAFLIVATFVYSGMAMAQCYGDIDRDNDTDASDLLKIIMDYGSLNCSLMSPCSGDLNEDGIVDEADILIFLDGFGVDCNGPAKGIWPTEGWMIATPAEMEMDQTKLEEARNYALTGGGSGVITRGGKLVMSWGSQSDLFDVKSTTKSIGVTVLGLALNDGLVNLTDRAQLYLPDIGIPPESNLATGWLDDITISQLATHTSGFDKPGGYYGLLFRPGTAWTYSDGGTNWLADVLTVVYGQDLNDLMFTRVFSLLGIDPSDLIWRSNLHRDDTIYGIKRREFGAGISISVDAMARIGYLYLREGAWDGHQVITRSFVDSVRTSAPEVIGLPVVNDIDSQFADASNHYGLLWWNNADGAMRNVPKDAFWSWGLYDSLIVVVPSLDIVASRAGNAWAGSRSPDGYSVLEPFIELICLSVTGNYKPYADAGGDQIRNSGDVVEIDGSGSTDKDGTITSYVWRQTGGVRVNFDATAVKPEFTAPVVTSSEILEFELTVTDDQGASDTDTVVVKVLPIGMTSFLDDFGIDSRSSYTVVDTWTQGGVGQFSYDPDGQRLRLSMGDNIGLEFGRQLPASEQGVFQLDFLPTMKYPNWGTFKLRLIEDADSYYEVYNTDGYVQGGVYKYVNGQLMASAAFTSSYVQNTGYRVGVSFSATGMVVQAFGNVVSLSEGSAPLTVNRFTLELRQQDAYIDNLGYSDDPLTSMVSLGDSITRGSKDDILSDGIGYPAILERLLTERNGSPMIVFNEGFSGHTSVDGAMRVAGMLDKHVFPRAFLVQYGSNDAQIPIPSGLGLSPGDPGHPGSFKDNMQRIISQGINAGKSPYLAKVPYSLGTYAYLRPHLQQYNAVIDELAVENAITLIPPDFYCFFEANTIQIADGLHPNGFGYQSMAQLWHDALAGHYGGCN